ncbi:MAG: MFS transporter [archaeon GB-1867-005]|nr:MFS transporter [Candidatus Culexmicrobium cathedralense]
MLPKIKEFFSRQSKNYLVLLFRRGYASLFNSLPMSYTSLYMKSLGMQEIGIGYLRSLGDAVSAIVSPFVGFFADVKSLKRSLMTAMLIEVITPLFYIFAWDWKLLILASIFSVLTMNIVNVVEVVYLANSLRRTTRATGFGISSTISTISSLIAPMIAAFIVETFGGISTEGIKPLFIVQFLGLAALAPIPMVFLKDIKGSGKKFNLRDDFKGMVKILKGRKWLQRWILIEALGGYVWGITMPYVMIYAVEYKGATPWILGLMSSTLNAISLLCSIPIGRLADKIGRVKLLVAFRPTFYLSQLIFILAPNPWFLIISWALRGVFFSSTPLWQTIAMELVPEEERGRWSGIKGFISGLVRIPSATIGGYIWTYLSPEAPFILALLIDLFIRLPLIYMTPETLKKEEYFRIYEGGQ